MTTSLRPHEATIDERTARLYSYSFEDMFPRNLAAAFTVCLLILAAADIAVPGLCRGDDSPTCGRMNARHQTFNKQNCSPTAMNAAKSCKDKDQRELKEDCFCCSQIIAVSHFEQQIDEIKSPSLYIVLKSVDISTISPIHHPPRSV